MKIFETYTVPATPAKEAQRCVGRTCDLCGKKGRGEDWQGHSEWEGQIKETDVKITATAIMKEGYSHRDGYHDVDIWEIDICPDCFEGKLVPWAQSFNPALAKKNENW